MGNRIITISREFGSGGRTVGKHVAGALGISCYDQELLERIAQESGFSKQYIAEAGEDSMGGRLASAFLGRDYSGLSNQDKIWILQRKLILELASKESCVIVGRCADFILKDKADCLNVFIHAPFEKRAQRIVEVYGETDIAPEKRLKEKDKRRKAYYQFYTDQEWGAAKNYHLCLDSSAIGLEKCVDIICGLY